MGTDNPHLAKVLRRLAVAAAAAVAVGGVAVWQAATADHPDASAVRTACSVAAATLEDPSRDAAEEAVRVLAAAGVAGPDADTGGPGCDDVWRAAGARAAGLTYSLLEPACVEATTALRDADGRRAMDAFANVGVTAENARWLPERCRATWLISVATQDATESDPVDAETATAACALANRQLARGDETDALATLTAVGGASAAEAGTCAPTWNLVSALAPPASDETGPEQVGGWWDDFVENFAAPLAAFGLAVLGTLLALFVVSRLFVELPRVRDLASSRASRRTAALAGIVSILVAAAGGGATAIAVGRGDLSGWWVVVLFAAIALVGLLGAGALACAIATLRRISITVTPVDDVALGETDVVRALRALAVETGPMELQSSPILADVDSALTKLSDNKVVAAAQAVTLFLVGIKPWRADIKVRSDREVTLTLDRNGRNSWMGAVATDAPRLAPLEPLPPGAKHPAILAEFIAAHILVRLSRAYPHEMKPGLNGATTAVSVAIQRVVLRWFADPSTASQAIALLAFAIDRDPENALAAATLQRIRYRDSHDVDDLVRLAMWLNEALIRGEGEQAPAPEAQPATRGGGAPSEPAPPRPSAIAERSGGGQEGDASGVADLEFPGGDLPTIAAPRESRFARSLLVSQAVSARNLVALVLAAAPTEGPDDYPEPPPIAERPPVLTLSRAREDARRADARARASLSSAKAHLAHVRRIAERLRQEVSPQLTAAVEATRRVAESAQQTADAAQSALAAESRDRCIEFAETAAARAKAAHENERQVAAAFSELRAELTRRSRPAAEKVVSAALARLSAAGAEVVPTDGDPAERATGIRLKIEWAALARARLVLKGSPPSISPAEAVEAALPDPSNRAFAGSRAALAYGMACYLVRWCDAPFGDRAVTSLFDVALAVSTYRKGIGRDAELISASDHAGYLDLVRRAERISEAVAAPVPAVSAMARSDVTAPA